MCSVCTVPYVWIWIRTRRRRLKLETATRHYPKSHAKTQVMRTRHFIQFVRASASTGRRAPALRVEMHLLVPDTTSPPTSIDALSLSRQRIESHARTSLGLSNFHAWNFVSTLSSSSVCVSDRGEVPRGEVSRRALRFARAVVPRRRAVLKWALFRFSACTPGRVPAEVCAKSKEQSETRLSNSRLSRRAARPVLPPPRPSPTGLLV